MSDRLIIKDVSGAHRPLELGPLIHKGGGAGRIMALKGDANSVVKLYHDAGIAAPYAPKIEAMLERRPDLPAISLNGESYVQMAWPTAMVEDEGGAFRGFTMPFIDLSHAAPLETLLVKALRRQHDLPENYAYRLFAARNVAAIVAELHRLGHHIVDLKPQNLSVYKRSMYIAVVDCDGLSINGGEGLRFPAGQFTDGYRAPETVARQLDPETLGEAQDRFALAVILFQLMNNGIHPFQGTPKRQGDRLGTQQERINTGHYPYGRRADTRQKPSPGSIHRAFEDETLDMFRRAFKSKQRPSAFEWFDHMCALTDEKMLQRCSVNREEHAHFSKGCGLCLVDKGKKKRLADARKRAQTRARAAPVRQRTTPRAYRVVFRNLPRRSHSQSSRRHTQRAGATNTGIGALLQRLIFGAPAAAPPTARAHPLARAGMFLVYGIYAVNLLVLVSVVTSMFLTQEFTQFSRALEEQGLLPYAEEFSEFETLQLLQAEAFAWVLVAAIAGLLLNVILQEANPGTIIATHAKWLTYSCIMAPPVVMFMILVSMLTWPYGMVALFLIPAWFVHRLAKGLRLLLTGRPLLAPTALF